MPRMCQRCATMNPSKTRYEPVTDCITIGRIAMFSKECHKITQECH